MVSKLRLRNEADRRMAEVISSLRFAVAPLGVARVSRGNLDTWIRELREREASVRRLRRRLEALQDGDAGPARSHTSLPTMRSPAGFHRYG